MNFFDLGKTFVIAEIGNNHEGDVNLAAELIRLAAEAGADAVKFQTIDPMKLVNPKDTTRIQQLNKFKLSNDDYFYLHSIAAEVGILFLSTPFSLDAVDFLSPLVPAYKISSGDLNFTQLLERVASTGKPMIVSTGMASKLEVHQAITTITEAWSNFSISSELCLLHCVSSYPAPLDQVNLSCLETLSEFGFPVGYSDHTLGINACLTAVALGAQVIEKHFTISHSYSDFRDHQLSANPSELKSLVTSIREVEQLKGQNIKKVTPSEELSRTSMRRSLCANHDLPANHVIDRADLISLRPGNGFPPNKISELIGRVTTVPLSSGDMITKDHIHH